jgi:hypothetical protein
MDYAGAWHEAPAGLLERLSLVTGAAWLFAVALRLGSRRSLARMTQRTGDVPQ